MSPIPCMIRTIAQGRTLAGSAIRVTLRYVSRLAGIRHAFAAAAAGWLAEQRAASMAPILAMAISEAKSLVGQIQTLVTKPPTAVAAPVSLDAGISAEQRALYAGSIVKLKSGKGYRATPIKAAVQLGTTARILGSSTGSVRSFREERRLDHTQFDEDIDHLANRLEVGGGALEVAVKGWRLGHRWPRRGVGGGGRRRMRRRWCRGCRSCRELPAFPPPWC